LTRPKWFRKEAQGVCGSRSLDDLIVADAGKENRPHTESLTEKLSKFNAIHWAAEVNVDKGKCGQALLDNSERLGTRRCASGDNELKLRENFANVATQ
jgi:hypothetical protein